MKRVILILMIGLSLLASNEAKAQDPHFSQFYANPLYLNPALAGTHGCPRLNFNYRNQWPALSGTFVTYSASYDQYFDNLSGGIGVLATLDQAGKGTINHLTFSFMYAYHLKLGRKWRFGMLVALMASSTGTSRNSTLVNPKRFETPRIKC